MPPSKLLEDDPEDAEIYSLSSLHQIHCLVSRYSVSTPPPPS